MSKPIILDNNTISNDTINYIVKTHINKIDDIFINGLVNYDINFDYILDTELEQLYVDNELHYLSNRYFDSKYIKLIYTNCNDKNVISENIYIKICKKGYVLPFLTSQVHTKNIIDIFNK